MRGATHNTKSPHKAPYSIPLKPQCSFGKSGLFRYFCVKSCKEWTGSHKYPPFDHGAGSRLAVCLCIHILQFHVTLLFLLVSEEGCDLILWCSLEIFVRSLLKFRTSDVDSGLIHRLNQKKLFFCSSLIESVVNCCNQQM